MWTIVSEKPKTNLFGRVKSWTLRSRSHHLVWIPQCSQLFTVVHRISVSFVILGRWYQIDDFRFVYYAEAKVRNPDPQVRWTKPFGQTLLWNRVGAILFQLPCAHLRTGHDRLSFNKSGYPVMYLKRTKIWVFWAKLWLAMLVDDRAFFNERWITLRFGMANANCVRWIECNSVSGILLRRVDIASPCTKVVVICIKNPLVKCLLLNC